MEPNSASGASVPIAVDRPKRGFTREHANRLERIEMQLELLRSYLVTAGLVPADKEELP